MSLNQHKINSIVVNESTSATLSTGAIVTEAGFSPATPINHARILWDNVSENAALAASSEESAAFSADAVQNHLTYEYWRPAAMPATLSFALSQKRIINCVSLGAHTLSSAGASVSIEYSQNGGVNWISVPITATPASNGALMLLFNDVVANAVRLIFTGSSVFSLGVVYVGKTLDMYRPIYSGHRPDTMSRATTIRPNRSVKGALLGWSVQRNGFSVSYQWDLTPLPWYRQNVDQFAVRAQTRPFFIAWNPGESPEDCMLAWTTKDITPSISGRLNYVEFSIDAEGLGDNLQ